MVSALNGSLIGFLFTGGSADRTGIGAVTMLEEWLFRESRTTLNRGRQGRRLTLVQGQDFEETHQDADAAETDAGPWPLHARKKRAGEKYFPLVLMLEPLHACNLACVGCGRIVEYKDTIRDQMPLEEALGAAQEADAPIVSICGGEPLMYKHIVPLTKRADRAQKRHVQICTNAILLERFVKQVEPSPYLSFNVHIDGMRETHDRVVDRDGVFDTCVRMIKLLKEQGLSRADQHRPSSARPAPRRSRSWSRCSTALGVDGMLLTPGYHYQVLTNDDIYLTRGDAAQVQARAQARRRLQDHQHTDLSRLPGRRPRSAVQPLDHRHAQSARLEGPLLPDHQRPLQNLQPELHEATDWEYYRTKQDIRCRDCKLHSGFEGTVALRVRQESQRLVADGTPLRVLISELLAPRCLAQWKGLGVRSDQSEVRSAVGAN